MKRKYNWLVPVVVAVGLLIYHFGWPWYRDRPARAAADALIAELDERGGQIEGRAVALPAIPENPTTAELGELLNRVATEMGDASHRMHELSKRTEEGLPKTPLGKREELRRALERYAARIGKALDAYKERKEQLRQRVEALKAGRKPGE